MSNVLVAGANPLAGVASGFGFEVPQGSPAAIDAAARVCTQQAELLGRLSGDVSGGTRIAVGGWQGQAEAAYAAYAGHVVGVLEANGEAFGAAGRAMASFSRELETAQRVTSQALRDCEAYNTELQGQLKAAADHGATARTLSQQAANAFHPQMVASLNHQASIAQDQANAASRAANAARGQLEAAQRRGQLAWETYQHEAEAAARTVQAAADQLQRVDRLSAGGMPALAGFPGGGTLAAAFPMLANPFANPFAAGVDEAGILPGVPLSTLDEYGILTGGAFGGMSAWAKQQLDILRLTNRATFLDDILSGPLSSIATPGEQAYAEAMAPQLAAELANLPEYSGMSTATLTRLANFSDHFGGFILGGFVDAGVRIAEGQNVVKSAAAGVGTTVVGGLAGAGGATVCGFFVVTAPAAPLCAAGAGAAGAYVGDKLGELAGGLIDDIGSIL